MSEVRAADGVALHCEATGSGDPVVFAHELAGSCRSFDGQVAGLSGRLRCLAFNARGYPPSAVPPALAAYSQATAAADIAAVFDGFALASAHLVGVSMGAASALQFALAQPGRLRSLTLVGIGSGSDMAPGQFAATMAPMADLVERQGVAAYAALLADQPNRVQLKERDPAAYRAFVDGILAMSPVGLANTMRGVQMRRPSLWDLVEDMSRLTLPTLIITGDEDVPCLEPALLMKRLIATSGLVILPKSGHTINLEEPEAFNRAVGDFLHAAELERWTARDPRSGGTGILGLPDQKS